MRLLLLTEDEIDELVLALKYPQQYIATKNAAKVELRAAPNGCSYSPDKWGEANFKPSCDKHEFAIRPQVEQIGTHAIPRSEHD